MVNIIVQLDLHGTMCVTEIIVLKLETTVPFLKLLHTRFFVADWVINTRDYLFGNVDGYNTFR